VLLSFDDGYRSFYTRVYPLLLAYDYPAVLALVTSWMEVPAGGEVDYGGRPLKREAFVTWDEVRTMQASGLVEIASHSHDLHRTVLSTPQGNSAPSARTWAFDPATGRREDDAAHRARIRADLDLSRARIAAETETETLVAVAHALRGEGFDASEDGTGRGTPLVPVAFDLRGREGGAMPEGPHDTANIRAASGGAAIVRLKDVGRAELADGLLGRACQRRAGLVAEIGDPCAQHRAAVHARQQPRLAQFGEVAPDGLGRHAEAAGQIVHGHALLDPRDRDDLVLAGRKRGHAGAFRFVFG
jgi:hypothetical protein